MTTTNIYQGLSGAKNTSRVLAPPGGGSSNIFGHYQEEEPAKQPRAHTETGVQGQGEVRPSETGSQSAPPTDHFQQDRDDYAANRARNQGAAAPFAVGDTPLEKITTPAPGLEDYQSPKQKQANEEDEEEEDGADNEQNPNLNKNTFSNIFGDSSSNESQTRGKGGFNPITGGAAPEPAKPSTRVRAPPGGISNITF